MPPRALRTAFLATLSALAGACATDPAPIAAPTLGIGTSDTYVAALADAPRPGPEDLFWWRRFDDPALAEWVERALVGSPDIAIARERVIQAQALLDGARARRSPVIGAQLRSALGSRGAGSRGSDPRASLALDWDTDLWGGLRQAQRSAAAGVLRSTHLEQASRLAIAGITARAVVEWREALADLAALADALALQNDVLAVARVRVEAGLSPRLDVERAQAEVAAVEAEIARAGIRSQQARTALQVLAGERPHAGANPPAGGGVAGSGEPATAVPALRGALPVGRPADLLRLRPDLRAAEEDLVAASAEVGVARAELLPRLGLQGTIGLASDSGILDLVTASIAALLDVALFDGGERRAGIDAAESRAREAGQVYRQTLLQALEQIESALVAAQGTEGEIEALERGIAAAHAAVAQARSLYSAGLSGLLDVLDARRTALAQHRQLLRARGDAARQAIAVFEAMGLIGESG
ncbi:MAG: efflux transporter outer membrane subunit [Burkholderiaceae bacterium]